MFLTICACEKEKAPKRAASLEGVKEKAQKRAVSFKGASGIPPKAEWSVTASLNSEKAPLAIDNDRNTGWNTSRKQSPGQRLKIDLGSEANINEVIIFSRPKDHPRSLVVEVSSDDKTYRKAKEIKRVPDSTETVISFKGPVQARYIRMTQTGEDDRYWWTVKEINIR